MADKLIPMFTCDHMPVDVEGMCARCLLKTCTDLLQQTNTLRRISSKEEFIKVNGDQGAELCNAAIDLEEAVEKIVDHVRTHLPGHVLPENMRPA